MWPLGSSEVDELLDLVPVAIMVRSFGTDTILAWSQGAEELYGWPRAEVLGKVTHDLLQTQFPASKEAVNAELRTAGIWSGELVHTRRDGRTIVVASRQAVQRDEHGQPTLTLEINSDLTASRNRLAAILSGVAEGIMAQDPAGRIVYANDTAARMCGFPNAEAFLSASVPEVVRRFEVFDEHGRRVAREDLPAQRVLRGEAAPESVVRFHPIDSDQDDRWSIVHATPLRDDSGRIHQIISIFRDISERRQSENTAQFLAAVNLELSRSLDYEQTLRRVADLAVPTLADWCAVDVLDSHGGLQRLGVAHVDPDKVRLAEELSARYPDNAASQYGPWRVAKTQNSVLLREISEDQIQAAARDPEHLEILRSLQIRSLIVVPLVARGRSLGTISLVAAESGRRYGPRDLAVAEDLAVRAALAVDNARLYQEAQEQARVHVELNAALRSAMTQLEHSLETRDEFLASAAHDLKNPLASMKAVAQLLLRRIGASDRIFDSRLVGSLEDGLQRIDSVASRATVLVEELLDIARMQMGRPLDLERNPTDLVQLAREAAAEQENRSELHEIRAEATPPTLVGLWDARRLSRAIGNLVDNAIKYSPEGGIVRLVVEREDGTAVLTIEDQGVGIPAPDLERVFQRFERGTNVAGEIAGTGIGLTSARHIVESHGGSISVTSQVGLGTRFSVRLPLD